MKALEILKKLVDKKTGYTRINMEVIIDGIVYVPKETKLEVEYPIFKRNKDGEVFRFDAIEDDGGYGQWVLHKNLAVLGVSLGTTPNSPVFETIPYDKERGLYHLQPVFFKAHAKISIGFYSVHDRLPLTEEGFICSNNQTIEPITPEQLKTMPFVWEMYQQLLKNTQ